MTKWKSKLAGMLAAGALAVAMVPAVALGATADTQISVTNIDEGDSAAYYQVIQQNASTKAWELTTAFADLDLSGCAGNTGKSTLDCITDGITAEEAGVIAALASGDGTAMTQNETTATTFEATVDPGMYLVLATPAEDNVDVVYKPMFVSADYDQSADSPNTVSATDELATAVAKKSPLELDKTAAEATGNGNTTNETKGVAVGDSVDFTVTTNVPSYTTNFTKPVFKITDVLSEGLTMTADQQAAITVTVAGYDNLKKGTDYTITPSASGYTIEFNGDEGGFLYTVTGNPQVTITYSAIVTSDAGTQVNELDNTVTLNFSNKPSDTSGQGELKDKTRHYTFDIDGSIFGQSGKQTSEVRKIGVDANGDPIEEITTTDVETAVDPDTRSWLEGATFELRTTANDASTAIKFTNGVKDADGSATITSDSNGYLAMKGLDEGTYYLVETAAPTGYSFDPTPHEITIAATYVDDADGNKILSEYTITIDGNVSKYTVGVDDETGKPLELSADGATITADPTNVSTLINNVKNALLPSTGGNGIYFYVIFGAAVAAVSFVGMRVYKKRAAATK